ncbi:MAG: tail fiber domain-containing protein [Hyphomicrobiales bacterium]|nr:tail fiber domain-containing protein [Hyphomicrobiales bacterium]
MSSLGELLGGVVEDFTGTDPNDPTGEKAAAEEDLEFRREALAQQEAEAERMREFLAGQSDIGIDLALQGGQQGADTLGQFGADALAALGSGQSDVLQALGIARGQGLDALLGGFSGARDDLRSGFGAARGDLGALTDLQRFQSAADGFDAFDVLGQRSNRAGGMLDREGGLFGGFEESPGFKFRQEQGEQAIQRAQAARGGRLGGAALKELVGFNQDLASQEFDKFAGRRQGELAGASGADASLLAALSNQAGRSDSANASRMNAQLGLAGRGFDAQSQLANLSSQEGQLLSNLSQAQGQTVSALESMFGTQGANALQDFATQTAGTNMQLGSGIGNFLSSAGSNAGNIAIGTAGTSGGLSQQLMNAFGQFGQAGGAQAGISNANKDNAATFMTMMAMFSDRRLKEDIQPASGPFGEIGLQEYTWTWNDEAKRLGMSGTGRGVMADEVAGVYPQAVVKDASGYLMVDYGLLDSIAEERGRE